MDYKKVMSRESALIKNTFVLSIGVFLPKLVGFITLPLLTAYLTTAEYGTYDLVTILATLVLPAVTLQIQTAAFRFLIDHRDDQTEIKKIITNIYAFIVPVSLLALVVMLFVLRLIDMFSRMLICLYFGLDILENATRQIARGMANNKDYSISAIISSLGKMFFAVIFVMLLDHGLNGALLCLTVSSFLSCMYLCVKGKVLRYFDIRYVNKQILAELISYSWPMVPNSLSMWVMSVSDRLLITLFQGIEANAVYAVANKIPSILALARTTFTMAWQENASISSKDDDVAVYYSSMYETVIEVMTGCLALLIAATPILFAMLIRGDYAAAYFQMPILSVAVLLDSLASFMGGIYVAYKKTKSVGLTTIAAATVNLTINFLLIKRIGLYAASLSTLISYLILAVYRMVDVRKFVNMQYNYKKITSCVVMITLMCVLCFRQTLICNVINFMLGSFFFLVLNRRLIKAIVKKCAPKLDRRK